MEENKVGIKVLVIGGSAGSLEALLKFLPKISALTFAIVIIVHRKAGDDRFVRLCAARQEGRHAAAVRHQADQWRGDQPRLSV